MNFTFYIPFQALPPYFQILLFSCQDTGVVWLQKVARKQESKRNY